MPDWHQLFATPYVYLLFGLFFIFMAVGYTVSGKIRVRNQGWVYRAEQPAQFWTRIAFYYVAGVGFIGYYLFKVYEGSH